jgi:hypothetical protein
MVGSIYRSGSTGGWIRAKSLLFLGLEVEKKEEKPRKSISLCAVSEVATVNE